MKRLQQSTIMLGLFLILAASASAQPTLHHLSGKAHVTRIKPLAFSVQSGRSRKACTRPLPASGPPIAVFVSINGHDAQSTASGAVWAQYWAARGTMVQTRSYPGRGPICARAMTWQRSARVRVRFHVLP